MSKVLSTAVIEVDPSSIRMDSQSSQLHFVLFPFMAPGHMIPMIDIAKILAQRNVIVTIITTSSNAARFSKVIARASESGYQIRLLQLQFPCKEAGLPDGCENLDMLPSLGTGMSLLNATSILQKPVEELFEELTPKPSCIISDLCLPYTAQISTKFNIPRITFSGGSCFYALGRYNLHVHNVLESLTSESEFFILPGIADKIQMTKEQIELEGNMVEGWKSFREKILEAGSKTYGRIMNTFEELEEAFVRDYKKAKEEKVWCIGPVSLTNKDHLDKAQRGNKASIDEHHCLKWLDLQKPSTVIYVCFGSLCNLTSPQLVELGLALQASNRPFIWATRGGNQFQELEKWIKENGFEERTRERSILIRGWAPQVLILSHSAIGGFITHCGWNSTLEAICAGVPMITWPLFGDQFFNEKLAVEILKVGVSVGANRPLKWGKEDKIGVLVKNEDVGKAIEKLMDEKNGSGERRRRARELAEMAKRAVEEGGSSHFNVSLIIHDIMRQIDRDE